jgi:hypothetical protein
MDAPFTIASLTDTVFEWYPVFGVLSSAGLLIVFVLLLRHAMGTTRPETTKASHTAHVLWDEVQGVGRGGRCRQVPG